MSVSVRDIVEFFTLSKRELLHLVKMFLSVIIIKIRIFTDKGVTLITFTLKSKQIRRFINIECNATLYLFMMLEELQFSEPEY